MAREEEPGVLTWGQAIFLAMLQGVTELFPVSSLGQSVLLPAFLGWGDVQASPSFVPFLVVLHLGTATALLVFYRDRWVGVVEAFLQSAVRGRLSQTPEEHLAWMLFFGTIPAGILGAVFESPLKRLFATPLVAAVFLVVNGGVMLLSERLRSRQGRVVRSPAGAAPVGMGGLQFAADEPEGTRGIKDLTWREAMAVGAAQALALIPGISRSGITMCGGLLIRLRHEEAADYAFMLATPLILAAGVIEAPSLLTAGGHVLATALVGGVLSGVGAYLSVRFLTRYFRFGRLDPFAYFCIVVGLVGLVFVGVHGS